MLESRFLAAEKVGEGKSHIMNFGISRTYQKSGEILSTVSNIPQTTSGEIEMLSEQTSPAFYRDYWHITTFLQIECPLEDEALSCREL